MRHLYSFGFWMDFLCNACEFCLACGIVSSLMCTAFGKMLAGNDCAYQFFSIFLYLFFSLRFYGF